MELHPAGATSSIAESTNGIQQVGFARLGGINRASLWTGTSSSWIDLNPPGSDNSYVYAVTQSYQAGYARIGGVVRAGIWTGGAATWIDLHPIGATTSVVLGASETQQAGYITSDGINRAVLWKGNAGSYVNLAPPAATQSFAYACHNEMQAGLATIGGITRAALWFGTSSSFVDLHVMLPQQYSSSEARAISSDTTSINIAGFATNSVTGLSEAILWKIPVAHCNGTVDFGQLTAAYNTGANLPTSIPVSFRDASNAEIATGSATYNPVTGAFSAAVPGSVTVPYRVSFKLGFWLRKTMPNPSGAATPLGNYNFGTVTPLVGDSDLDNEVTNFDYSLWAAANGNSVTANTDNDFDGDGEITNFDYSLWAANNGALGDN